MKKPAIYKTIVMKPLYQIPLFAIILCICSCKPDHEESFTVTFSFYDDANGWIGDFADYPAGEEAFYELSAAWAHLPAPLDTTKGALRISGNNHSDDLFMYITRKVDGLSLSTSYQVTFDLELASDAPTNAAGIGGPPGEGVTLKVGAVPYQPSKLLGDNDFYVINLDKGNQTSSGSDMVAIGHIGVSDTTTVYTLIKRNNDSSPFTITTDEYGKFWVVIGTDSGFEGITTLYYSKIKLTITRN
jgi:hypothetical protein